LTSQPTDPSPSAPSEPPAEHASIGYNARLGILLFFIYLALYGGFVMVATFSPKTMERPALRGVNLAIIYGLGLIVGAFMLSIIYMLMARSPAKSDASVEGAP
jgi:uncharacterized membrane protein (DUF485 family)